jgi:hypothetical protein
MSRGCGHPVLCPKGDQHPAVQAWEGRVGWGGAGSMPRGADSGVMGGQYVQGAGSVTAVAPCRVVGQPRPPLGMPPWSLNSTVSEVHASTVVVQLGGPLALSRPAACST